MTHDMHFHMHDDESARRTGGPGGLYFQEQVKNQQQRGWHTRPQGRRRQFLKPRQPPPVFPSRLITFLTRSSRHRPIELHFDHLHDLVFGTHNRPQEPQRCRGRDAATPASGPTRTASEGSGASRSTAASK